MRKCLPKHAKYNAVGREKRRKSDCACRKVYQKHVKYDDMGRETAKKATERAEKSAKSISNMM